MALSDPEGILASPLTIIGRTDETADIEAIVNVINVNRAERIIAGLPRSMDGSLRTQAEKVEAFVRKLREKTEVPVEFRDERLSTVLARRLMQAAAGKKRRQKARDDAIAAAIILQSYLDETLHNNNQSRED